VLSGLLLRTQGFVERVELLPVSLWKVGENIFPRGVGVQEEYNGWL